VLLPFCLDQLNFVKIAAFLQLGKLKKVGWVGDDSHIVLVNNSLVKKDDAKGKFLCH
jgi:hypothetical protein